MTLREKLLPGVCFVHSAILETLVSGLLTSVTCMFSKQRCPACMTMRAARSVRIGIEVQFASTYRTPSELPVYGLVGMLGLGGADTSFDEAPEPEVIQRLASIVFTRAQISL